MNKTTENDPFMSPAFLAAAKIRASKSDYGSIAEYFPFGVESFCHEIHKKSHRLVNLAKSKSAPNWEPTEDNLLDLINYASYYYEYLTEGIHEREK